MLFFLFGAGVAKPQCSCRVITNLKNMGNLETSENLRNCQNLRENSGEIRIFVEKPGKLRETYMICDEFLSLELLGGKFESALEISEKTQGI